LSREGVHTWTEGRASAIRAVERGLDTPGGRGLRSSFLVMRPASVEGGFDATGLATTPRGEWGMRGYRPPCARF
jgi:hypothetical protein